MKIGFHASHEQFPPSELLQLVVAAEAAGFQCAMSSDHFKPWSVEQGHSGFAWSWIGAALARTRFPVGMISVPGYRYHVAVIAQGAATLAEMFPDRYWLGLGSGERLNEDITGEPWPSKSERNSRLKECAQVIDRLLQGERVTHRGITTTIDAQIYSRPKRKPLLLGAALTEGTAQFVASFSDGLLTVQRPREQLKRMIDAFRRGGGEGKPIYVQVALNWAKHETDALRGAHEQWKFSALGAGVSEELRSPEDFDAATRSVRSEDMHRSVLISADLGRHAAWLAEIAELGVDQVVLHQVDRNQRDFIDAFGTHVIPQVS